MPEGRENKPFHQEEESLGENRLKKVLKFDHSLEIVDELGEGSTATIYNCKKDNQDRALKLSIMAEGISDAEANALNDLSMVLGVPQVIDEYSDDNKRIALLLEKIEGKHLDEYLAENQGSVSEVFLKIEKMIGQIHNRGYLLPNDCLKDDNWLVDEQDQPYLIDFGEPLRVSEDIEQAEFQMKGDQRLFHSLIYKYIDKVGKKEKKKLQDILLRDYYLNR